MIFESLSEKKWKTARNIFLVVVVFSIVLIGNLIVSFFTNPSLLTVKSLQKPYGKGLKDTIQTQENSLPSNKLLAPSISSIESRKINTLKKENSAFLSKDFISIGFLGQEEESLNDLKRNTASIEYVFPEALSLSSKNTQNIDFHLSSEIEKYLTTQNKKYLLRFSDTDELGNWKGKDFIELINSNVGDAFIEKLKNIVIQHHALGVNLDIEDLGNEDKEILNDWVFNLVKSFHQNNLYVTIDLPMNEDAFDYEFLGAITDATIIMAYDEHYAGGKAGPIASNAWFINGVDDSLQRIPKEKLIMGVGNYAYDWNITSHKTAEALSFDEAMNRAQKVGADIETEKGSINSYFEYEDSKGEKHIVWILDGISLWNEYNTIREKGVKGISLWKLGLEDPSTWKFYGKDIKEVSPDDLKSIPPENSISYVGDGEFYKVTAIPNNGEREITTDDVDIDYARYTIIPTSYIVEKFFPNNLPQVLFTFDDGPDPTYTPQILDILKKNGISGVFFMIGDQVERYPNIVKQVYDDGNYIGNHTYYHPNIGTITPSRLNFELNSTQRFIESIIGHSTLLFRAPYDTDSTPTSAEQLNPLYAINKLGYINLGANVDSSDYKKPGVDFMVNDVLSHLDKNKLNVIVMHDAGGERTQTVEALKKLIPAVKDEGFKIVSLSDITGIPRDSFMRDLSLQEKFISWGNAIYTFCTGTLWICVVILFFFTTVISILRVVYLGYFVFKGKNNSVRPDTKFQPPITVIIPAYNEEKVIKKTVMGVLGSNYTDKTILIVDDGSTDNTVKIVKEIGEKYPNVKLIQKENGGKFSALNLGFTSAETEYIVTIDADTIVLKNTLSYLIAPFKDKNIDAVCGNIEVGNTHNILTKFQDVEYTTSQNYDRRAFDELNCISVVPGATGSWRKSKILAVGGYSEDTLTEDADLTLTLLENGGKIVYSPLAKSYTEAPEDIKSLYKQRFRWTYGTFQCLWKHKSQFGKGNLGKIALPNMFLFQVIFPILSPLGDAIFILSIIRGDAKPIIFGYITFLFMDLAGSLIAFSLEKKSYKNIWVVLFQRFFYRQFMYFVTYKSIIASLKGKRHGWNKLTRTSTVQAKVE